PEYSGGACSRAQMSGSRGVHTSTTSHFLTAQNGSSYHPRMSRELCTLASGILIAAAAAACSGEVRTIDGQVDLETAGVESALIVKTSADGVSTIEPVAPDGQFTLTLDEGFDYNFSIVDASTGEFLDARTLVEIRVGAYVGSGTVSYVTAKKGTFVVS